MNGIVLFDGVCNFCNGSVSFIIERDTKNYFKFAPLQSDAGIEYLEKYDIDKTKIDSVILIENDRAYTYSTAALRIAKHLNGAWSWLYSFIFVPKILRDFVYKTLPKIAIEYSAKRKRV